MGKSRFNYFPELRELNESDSSFLNKCMVKYCSNSAFTLDEALTSLHNTWKKIYNDELNEPCKSDERKPCETVDAEDLMEEIESKEDMIENLKEAMRELDYEPYIDDKYFSEFKSLIDDSAKDRI